MKQLEAENVGLQILNNLRNGYIFGPATMHTLIKEKLHSWIANIQTKKFVIENQGLGFIGRNEVKQFAKICHTHRCAVKTGIESINKSYPVPMSGLDNDTVDTSPAAMSIDIRVGDLATQSVDMVVVCSTSINLLNNILGKAGPKITNDFITANNNGQITVDGYETEGGELFCQRLLFIPWITEKVDDVVLRQSIGTFFRTAIHYALMNNKHSIAFPALGCGDLNYNPNTIAEIILEETQQYANYQLKILIVLLEDKIEHYRAFCSKLAELRKKTSSEQLTNIIFPHKSKYLVYSLF